MKGFNVTDLNPGEAFERHIYHRDMFAHYLRWSHVLKLAKIGMKILDVGCGDGALYEVFYRNRYKPARYLGLDVRKNTIEKNKVRFPLAEFAEIDITAPFNMGADWDVITSFETLEHVGKWRVPAVLDNIKKCCNDNTIVLISTPCYDPKIGAAGNHTYDSGDGDGNKPQELTYQELSELLSLRFTVERVFGTFASQRDYKPLLSGWRLEMFNELNDYYDTNLLSNLMAPLFPHASRNCLWRCHL